MKIYEQIKDLFKDKTSTPVSTSTVKSKLFTKYGTNPGNIILSDYCYNRINDGIKFDKHFFQYCSRNTYKVLEKDYPYTGFIYHRPKGKKEDVIVGEWKDGIKIIY